jgi:hypothetical protein
MGLDLKIDLPDDLGVSTTDESLKYNEVVREVVPLEESDLKALELMGPSRSQSGVQHLRAYHHNVALRLAAGERPVEICAILGLQPQTITRLQKTTQFSELVEAYRERVVASTVDHVELMGLVGAESLMAMHERLTGKDREDIPLEMLRRIGADCVDRIGHSPVRRSETLSRHQHELSRETLDRIKQLHGEDSTYEAQTVESTPVEVHKEESKGAGAAECITGAFGPLPEKEANGKPRKGNGVPEEGVPLLSAGDGSDSEEGPV